MKNLPGFLVCLFPLVAPAEFIAPQAAVEDHVNIRLYPDAKSEMVGRLYRGDAAKLVQSFGDWHEIEIAGGATGYISAEWTVVIDELPVVADAAPVHAGDESMQAVPSPPTAPAGGEAATDGIPAEPPEPDLPLATAAAMEGPQR